MSDLFTLALIFGVALFAGEILRLAVLGTWGGRR